MRFLIVDDSPIMRRIVINALKSTGYSEFMEAEDGDEGLSKLKQEPFDFVITDWNMPKMSGLDLAIAIRSDEQLKHLPIIIVTTRGAKEDIINALKAKVNNYLVKPFTPQLLKDKIDAVLAALKH